MIISGTDMRIMRLRGGKTTTEMAEVVGLKTRKTYENWEQNRGCPNMNQYLKMVRFCGFDAGALINMYIDRQSDEEHINVMEAKLE